MSREDPNNCKKQGQEADLAAYVFTLCVVLLDSQAEPEHSLRFSANLIYDLV